MTCLSIFRLIFQEETLLEQEDVPIGCGEHQSLVTGILQDINFTISLGFPKTWLRLVGLGMNITFASFQIVGVKCNLITALYRICRNSIMFSGKCLKIMGFIPSGPGDSLSLKLFRANLILSMESQPTS